MSSTAPVVIMVGLESVGKSALFRVLTGGATGDEANFRGSTVVCRRGRVADAGFEIVDTPGIRLDSDSDTTRLALNAVEEADIVLLVARSTQAHAEITSLLQALPILEHRLVLALTFADRANGVAADLVDHYRRELGIPVVALNARDCAPASRGELLLALAQAGAPRQTQTTAPFAPVIVPREWSWERHRIARLVAVIWLLAMFAVPVYLAHRFASAVQPLLDTEVITPLKVHLAKLPPLLEALLGGRYGVITLGWYSFLWAFPVVVLIGITTAINEETGLKERVATLLDPWMQRIGLSGRDLIPVLTGFGCNVVAVLQSRSCSRCTRRACISLISLGSACSYQIGASMSVFGAAGAPALFAPYLFVLFTVGLLHTRLWHGALSPDRLQILAGRPFLQWPSWRAVGWRVRAITCQFLLQAMPMFLGICLLAAFLEHVGFWAWLCDVTTPLMRWFRLPPEVAPAVLFSILRKDGLLTLHQDGGGLVQSLSMSQTFTVVWLASTVSACTVTLGAVAKEVGIYFALTIALRQAMTAIFSGLLLAWLLP